jgi:hypothetical protein
MQVVVVVVCTLVGKKFLMKLAVQWRALLTNSFTLSPGRLPVNSSGSI